MYESSRVGLLKIQTWYQLLLDVANKNQFASTSSDETIVRRESNVTLDLASSDGIWTFDDAEYVGQSNPIQYGHYSRRGSHLGRQHRRVIAQSFVVHKQ